MAKVQFLKDHKSFKKDDKVDLDDETARRWSQPGRDIVKIISDRAHVDKVVADQTSADKKPLAKP